MSNSVKALLLSAFVFPGAGHYFLKKPVQGTILAGASLACLYGILSISMSIAQGVASKIQTGELPLDATRLEQELQKESSGTPGLVDLMTFTFGACWFFGIADSFRIGRATDKADAAKGKT